MPPGHVRVVEEKLDPLRRIAADECLQEPTSNRLDFTDPREEGEMPGVSLNGLSGTIIRPRSPRARFKGNEDLEGRRPSH